MSYHYGMLLVTISMTMMDRVLQFIRLTIDFSWAMGNRRTVITLNQDT